MLSIREEVRWLVSKSGSVDHPRSDVPIFYIAKSRFESLRIGFHIVSRDGMRNFFYRTCRAW